MRKVILGLCGVAVLLGTGMGIGEFYGPIQRIQDYNHIRSINEAGEPSKGGGLERAAADGKKNPGRIIFQSDFSDVIVEDGGHGNYIIEGTDKYDTRYAVEIGDIEEDCASYDSKKRMVVRILPDDEGR